MTKLSTMNELALFKFFIINSYKTKVRKAILIMIAAFVNVFLHLFNKNKKFMQNKLYSELEIDENVTSKYETVANNLKLNSEQLKILADYNKAIIEISVNFITNAVYKELETKMNYMFNEVNITDSENQSLRDK